jgi:hypothetical protein
MMTSIREFKDLNQEMEDRFGREEKGIDFVERLLITGANIGCCRN